MLSNAALHIAHTLGTVNLISTYLPEVEIVLWPENVKRGVKEQRDILNHAGFLHSFARWKLTSGVDGRMLATRYGHAEQNEAFMLQQAQASDPPPLFPTLDITSFDAGPPTGADQSQMLRNGRTRSSEYN